MRLSKGQACTGDGINSDRLGSMVEAMPADGVHARFDVFSMSRNWKGDSHFRMDQQVECIFRLSIPFSSLRSSDWRLRGETLSQNPIPAPLPERSPQPAGLAR